MNTSFTRRAFVAGASTALAAAAGKKMDDAPGPRFFVAALTALDQRGNLDDAIVKDYLAYLAGNGADGALVLGTTGEFASFSVKERKQILESYARHRGRLALMAQVGAPNVPDTLELLAHAAGAGADAALVAPPFYYKNVSTEGLVHFYEPVLDSSRIPILLYNIPQTTGVPITAELLHRLSFSSRLYGIKDSFSKVDAMTSFIREFPKVKIFTGVPGNIGANLGAGGAGAITGNGSAFTRETSAVFQAFRNNSDTASAQAKLDERARLLAGYETIPAQKFALTRSGLAEMHCRPPLTDLSTAQKKSLAERFNAA
jgi:4-hydroxy-tetrahydrodipicolinate synthase